MKNIVTIDWLAENLNNENLVILDCRFGMKEQQYGLNEYIKSHINNAIYIDLKDLIGEVKEHGGRHPLPSLNGFVKMIENSGVDDEKVVVIYDDGELAPASRLWFMLKYIGIKDAYVLNGGFSTWIERKLPVTEMVSKPKESKGIRMNINSKLICDKEYVRENFNKEESIIVDSRSRERYLGLEEPLDKKAGHIPGAINYFWRDNFNGIKIKDLNILKERFEELNDYKKIIVHCGSGVSACVNVLLMSEIGLKPILYLGSWSDWISYDDNEIISEKLMP
ncbi:sulfurtransferase [Oceanirhabdus sp. W0125-5]|uniref:sulfurtransferase n=1 Tax=Oceanirhabdus sp. W0125-5 TaxID=2999116 RepID=UPI0022F2F36C|nr:sulfurtransferase [Oceanirhabdus sp. W0125-5]WBW99115.1 sulfurtransferase [Oceanirhabdus sp. W0125-5]